MDLPEKTCDEIIDDIRNVIASSGISMVVVSPFVKFDDTNTPVPSVDPNHMCTHINDGYVYCIGNHIKDIPDMIVLCGPNAGETLTVGQLLLRMKDAQQLILSMTDWWHIDPGVPGDVYETQTSQRFVITGCTREEMEGHLGLLNPMYYGSIDYKIITLAPLNTSGLTGSSCVQ